MGGDITATAHRHNLKGPILFQFALNVANAYALIGKLIVPVWAVFLTCVAGYIAFSDN